MSWRAPGAAFVAGVGAGWFVRRRRRWFDPRRAAVLRAQRDQQAIAQQLAHVGSFQLDVGTRQLVWSDELARIFGLDPGSPPTLEGFFERVHAEDRGRFQQAIEAAIAERSTFALEARIVRPDGSLRSLLSQGRLIIDGAGRPRYVIGSCQDITDRRATEEQRDRLARIVEFSEDAIIGLGSTLEIETWNSGAVKLYGYAAAEALGRPASIMVPPAARDAQHARLLAILAGKHFDQYDAVHVRADGSLFEVSIATSPIRNTAGAIIGIAKIVRDVSARAADDARLRASLTEKDVLLREIHHRVKNNLQVVSSLLHLQIAKLENADARRALTDSQSRIQSMALVHQLLYESKDFASIDFTDYLRALADRLVRTYRPGGEVHVEVIDSPIRLDIDRAIACGLIVNELLANALTHAFPDERPGRVSISLIRDDRAGVFVLDVEDDGVGVPAGLSLEETKSFGLKIARTLSEQLGGRFSVTCTTGTRARVEFPAPPSVADAHPSATAA